MTTSPHTFPRVGPVHRDVAARRACLRCKTMFFSEGFGERICPQCKGSVAWRSGLSVGNGQARRRSASRSG